MKIVLLTTDYLPQVGGVSNYLSNLIESTKEKIDWVVYSTIPDDGHCWEKLDYPVFPAIGGRDLGQRIGDGFPITRKFNTLKWRMTRQSVANDFIKNIVKAHSPDRVLIGRWCETASYWCKACADQKIPYDIPLYGLELREPMNPEFEARRIQDIRSCDQLYTISQGTTAALRDLGIKDDPVFIPPGIWLKDYPKIDSVLFDKIIDEKGLAGRRYVLSVGRLVKRKGFDWAMRAFDAVHQDYEGLDFVLAGIGDELDLLKELHESLVSKERIHILGEVTHQEKQALLQGCEFYTMPNRPLEGDMEGFGIVFLEANLYQKAALGGNNGGVPDAVEDDCSGLLVDTSETIDPLVSAFRKLLDEPVYAAKLGEQGYQRAKEKFQWSEIGKAFIRSVE